MKDRPYERPGRTYSLPSRQSPEDPRQGRGALAAIEAEIEEHGYYPASKAPGSIEEVCRRASIGISTLKNDAHDETKEMVKRRLARLKKKAPTAKPEADDAKREKITDLLEKVNEIAGNYNRFKIEYDKLLSENARLEAENAALRKQNDHPSGDGKIISSKKTKY